MTGRVGNSHVSIITELIKCKKVLRFGSVILILQNPKFKMGLWRS